jgi:hypothetical protein
VNGGLGVAGIETGAVAGLAQMEALSHELNMRNRGLPEQASMSGEFPDFASA